MESNENYIIYIYIISVCIHTQTGKYIWPSYSQMKTFYCQSLHKALPLKYANS